MGGVAKKWTDDEKRALVVRLDKAVDRMMFGDAWNPEEKFDVTPSDHHQWEYDKAVRMLGDVVNNKAKGVTLTWNQARGLLIGMSARYGETNFYKRLYKSNIERGERFEELYWRLKVGDEVYERCKNKTTSKTEAQNDN